MFGRIILTALAAGLISGVFVWGAHMVKTTPLILAAEVYEDQAAGHQPTPANPEQTPAAQPEAWPRRWRGRLIRSLRGRLPRSPRR